VIGAGIAGVATAFFLLRDTDANVLLVERDRVGRGATGHNAGQLTTYSERPLCDLVEAYGFQRAIAAQRAIDDTWGLLEIMVTESGSTAPIDRFVGRMGMFTLDHLTVHLRNSALRHAGGLFVPECLIADDAPFLTQIPTEYTEFYSVVPRQQVHRLLDTGDSRYCAVLSDRKGCANGALLSQQIVDFLRTTYPGRFDFVDHTRVDRIVLQNGTATVYTAAHRVTASRVVMCTNGFSEHVVENVSGGSIAPQMHHRVDGDVGYMVAFVEQSVCEPRGLSYIRNEVIGGSTPYVYLTSRTYDGPQGKETLVCIGGPEELLDDTTTYSAADWQFPDGLVDEIDGDILPIVYPTRAAGLEYDYMWHGLMGYTESRVRLIGFEPANSVLMYNLGCNGVGFLPSIYGGYRVAHLHRGDSLEATIFDPPE
jgi:glycine/D-amino acid oxidase-like deaminating enzyme